MATTWPQLIYAGADLLVVPSLFEPCGFAHMIGLRYGSVPIVRAVGGLADTISDPDHSMRAMEQRNGYVFHQADHPGIVSAMDRALGLLSDFPDEFRKLVVDGMRCDYS